MKPFNNAPGAPAPVGAYSQAVEAGGLLFLSGQIGLDSQTGKMVSELVEEQAQQVLKNIKAVLEHCGSDWGRVAMTTIFLSDINDAAKVNELYGSVVDRARAPARQTVAVKALPLGAKVEISVVALK